MSNVSIFVIFPVFHMNYPISIRLVAKRSHHQLLPEIPFIWNYHCLVANSKELVFCTVSK